MGVLLKIAYRNLREHKVKTLIIGSIIALGMLVLVVGNSVLDTATAGIRANYTDNYTGHVIVAASSVESPALTPDAGFMSGESAGSVPEYQDALSFLESYPGVSAVNPLITGIATAQIDGEGFGIMQFYGVDPDRYLEFFPDNIELIDGQFLSADQEGVVLSETTLSMLEETAAREIGVGDSILLTSQNEISGTKIREVEIVGIFRFVNATGTLQIISFVDIENVRVLNGMTAITDLDSDLTDGERSLLGEVNEDDLFGGSLVDGSVSDQPLMVDLAAETGNGEFEAVDFDSILGDVSVRSRLSAVDENAWHYLLLKLNDEGRITQTVRNLNTEFSDAGMELVAFEWLDGAGAMAALTYGLKTVFNFLILLVAVVAVIIIMNTLVISVTERIAEIGTMRAIGAQKRFVRRMIMLETLMIAGVFGAIGIFGGAAITGILGATGIESDTQFLQIFMGGPVLNPVVSARSVLMSLLSVVAAGLMASLYPAAVALRIQPVTAMNQN